MAREWPHLHGAGNDSVFAGVHRPHRLDHYAQGYYKNPDGTSTSEVDMIRQALRPLRLLYGPTPAVECALKALRLAMMSAALHREGFSSFTNSHAPARKPQR